MKQPSGVPPSEEPRTKVQYEKRRGETNAAGCMTYLDVTILARGKI